MSFYIGVYACNLYSEGAKKKKKIQHSRFSHALFPLLRQNQTLTPKIITILIFITINLNFCLFLNF